MNSAVDYIGFARMILLLIIVMLLLIKLVLFYRNEKEWNSITFFHFNRIQLKLTNSRHLRASRKNQNNMTTVIFVLLIILMFVSFIYSLSSH